MGNWLGKADRPVGMERLGLGLIIVCLSSCLARRFPSLSGIVSVISRFRSILLVGLASLPRLVHIPSPNLRGTRTWESGRRARFFMIIRNSLQLRFV